MTLRISDNITCFTCFNMFHSFCWVKKQPSMTSRWFQTATWLASFGATSLLRYLKSAHQNGHAVPCKKQCQDMSKLLYQVESWVRSLDEFSWYSRTADILYDLYIYTWYVCSFWIDYWSHSHWSVLKEEAAAALQVPKYRTVGCATGAACMLAACDA